VARPVLTVEQVLKLLRETVPRIGELTAGLGPDELHASPGPGEWSVNDVLAHLRACADVWGDGIAKILAEDAPTIHAVNPRTWMKSTNYPGLKFRSSFKAYARQRTDLLAILEALPRRSWSRKAVITGAGSVLEWTVLIYATRIAVHERSHLKQIRRIVGVVG
jgi:uncharacterized damage-inducible protein DinB